MKNKIQIAFVIIIPIILCTISACSSQGTSKEAKEQKKKFIVDDSLKKGVVLVGTKEDVERAKKAAKDLVDPANDYALEARRLYKQKKYDQAEQEALKAIKEAKHNIVRLSGHNTLLDIYEVTKRYELAIKEINWLLDHVNDHAKPGLLKKKAEFEKLL